MKRIILLCLMLAAVSVSAHAEVSIETAVSRSSLPVGDQLTLDIIITNAEGRIEKPVINSIEGFTSYSQGHSQEFSIINGRSSSRSIYSYVLVANSTGAKTIGPFAVVIAGKEYKVAPVKVEVTQSGVTQGGYTWAQGPVSTPSPRSMPSGAKVGEQDIFVKAWLDKDEVYLNEPVMLTFTLFTRLSATYKGFEKEPVTTGFWVEDFPPEKTIRRTEQFLNGQRYVVADVRKMALFPTSVGAFTIDPGTLSATVEVHGDDGFQTFFSSNIFGGRRSGGFPQGFTTEMVNKVLPSDPVRLIVKALPENGKPKTFSGAVGQFEIESSIDKNDVEVGDPVTLKVKIAGRGNINTLQTPKLPVMDAFKVYDSSSSTHISKERLVVEGDKVTETVIVPKRPGVYEIPSTTFTYFDVNAGEYRTLKTEAHRLTVRGTAAVEEPASRTDPASSAEDLLEPADKADVDFVAKDIRYIKTADSGRPRPRAGSLTDPLYWGLNLVLLGLCGFFTWLSTRGGSGLMDAKGHRMRRSHSAARAKLRQSAVWMKQGKQNEFYAEISRAVHGYFADKFDVPAQAISTHRIEELAGEIVSAELLNKIKKLFDEMSSGRFAKDAKDAEHMSDVYDQADAVISAFEKVRIKK